MAQTFYADDETTETIKKLKRIEQNFNLSSFIKEKILEFAAEKANQILDINYLRERIASLENEKETIQRQINHFIGLVRQAEEKQEEIEYQEKEREEKQKQQYKERIKAYLNNITEFWEVPENEAKVLAQEFEKVRNETDLWDFMTKKKYPEKINNIINQGK